MNKIHYTSIVFLMLLAACYPKSEWYRTKILQQESNILNLAKSGVLDSTSINQLLVAYEDYADKHPSDPQSVEFLYKAADFYRAMNMPLRSISVYEKIYETFPNHSQRPKVLFLQGFIYENDVKNYTAAQIKYHEFLTQYPDHPLAKDVKLSLQLMGKSPEQLIEEFKKQTQDSVQIAGK